MASGERRLGTARRGMTVLGKIPAVPKPINLPSQRLENKGLDPSVEIVPRGTFTWGTGRSPPTSGNSWGAATLGSSPPVSTGAWNNASNSQAPNMGSVGGSLAQSSPRPKSAGSSRPSSAPTTTGKVWGGISKLEEQLQPSRFNLTSVDFPTLGAEKNPNLRPQPSTAAFSRPTSADGMKERQTAFSEIASYRPTSADGVKERQELYSGRIPPSRPISVDGPFSEGDTFSTVSNRPASADGTKQRQAAYPGYERTSSNRVTFIDVPSSGQAKQQYPDSSSFTRPAASSDGRQSSYSDMGMSNRPPSADGSQSFKQRHPVFMAGPGPGTYSRFEEGHNMYPSRLLQHAPASKAIPITPGLYPTVSPQRFQGPIYENIENRDFLLLGVRGNGSGYGNYPAEAVCVDHFGRPEMFHEPTGSSPMALGTTPRGMEIALSHERSVLGPGRERYYGFAECSEPLREKWPRKETTYVADASGGHEPNIHNTCTWAKSTTLNSSRRPNPTWNEALTPVDRPIILLEKTVKGPLDKVDEKTMQEPIVSEQAGCSNHKMLENEKGIESIEVKGMTGKHWLHEKEDKLRLVAEHPSRVSLPSENVNTLTLAKGDNESEVAKCDASDAVTAPISGSVQILCKSHEAHMPEYQRSNAKGLEGTQTPSLTTVGLCSDEHTIESGEGSEAKLSNTGSSVDTSVIAQVSDSNKSLTGPKRIALSKRSTKGSRKDNLSNSKSSEIKESEHVSDCLLLSPRSAISKAGVDKTFSHPGTTEMGRPKLVEVEISPKSHEQSAQPNSCSGVHSSAEACKTVEEVQICNEDGTNKKTKRKQARRFPKDRPHEPHSVDKHVEGMVWTPVRTATTTVEAKTLVKDKVIQEHVDLQQHSPRVKKFQTLPEQVQQMQSAASDGQWQHGNRQDALNQPVMNVKKEQVLQIRQQPSAENSQKRQGKQAQHQRVDPEEHESHVVYNFNEALETEKHSRSIFHEDHTQAQKRFSTHNLQEKQDREGGSSSSAVDKAVARKNRDGNTIYIPKPARQQLSQEQEQQVETCSEIKDVNAKQQVVQLTTQPEFRRNKDSTRSHFPRNNGWHEAKHQDSNAYNVREKHVSKHQVEEHSGETVQQKQESGMNNPMHGRVVREKQSAASSNQEHRNVHSAASINKEHRNVHSFPTNHRKVPSKDLPVGADDSKDYIVKHSRYEAAYGTQGQKHVQHSRAVHDSEDSIQSARGIESTKKKDDIEIYTPKPARQQQVSQLSASSHHAQEDRTKPDFRGKDMSDSSKTRKEKSYVAKPGRQHNMQFHQGDAGQMETSLQDRPGASQEKQGKRKDEIKFYTPKAVRQQQAESIKDDDDEKRELQESYTIKDDDSRPRGSSQSSRHGNHPFKPYKPNPRSQSQLKVHPPFEERDGLVPDLRTSVSEFQFQQNQHQDSATELNSVPDKNNSSKLRNAVTDNHKRRVQYQPVSHLSRPQEQESGVGYEQSGVDHRHGRSERWDGARRGRNYSSGHRAMNHAG